ncbi:SusC/RagA family TonB-linked outer membrane protein [Filimonas effusa]|uniref:TonB-dependent receptor n=1 Tax=Filimonas effusa TaxID=2508721 RepID=A0A4Q1D9L4_9BACT|nr:hypothetical protein [Filimonas effusa]RXK86041.1 hypothetical protein ESB13_04320 [Filimonas effusa]
MKYLICLFMIIPSLANAQRQEAVEPIISQDYQYMVRQERKPLNKLDSFIARHRIPLKLLNRVYGYQQASKLRISDTGTVEAIYTPIMQIVFKGSFRTLTELRTHNRLPALQSNFVQGRNVNGATAWRGPETNEAFSYGPAASSLEFDGSAYPFDNNGRLTEKGQGNGKPAFIYDNGIFRPAVHFTQEAAINAYASKNYYKDLYFNLSLKRTTENTFIRDNKNWGTTLLNNIGFPLGPIAIKTSYTYSGNNFSNSNRTGFLNRVYQNSLLTPVSFSNEQGNRLSPTQQRSFSNSADNALFLLNNDNAARWRQHAGSVSLAYTQGNLELKNMLSILSTRQQDKEVFQPGASAWPNGMSSDRNATSLNYTSRSELLLKWLDLYKFNSSVSARHLFTHEQTRINYQPDDLSYRYTRDANDILLSASAFYNPGALDLGLSFGNGFYTSNTAAVNAAFLPFFNLKFGARRIMTDLDMTLTGGFRRFNSEPALNQSMSAANLLLLQSSQVAGYRPVKEALRYDGLAPIEHGEWTSNIEFTYNYRYNLLANFYVRNTRGDVYPFHSGNNLLLDNIAGIRKKGMELTLTIREAAEQHQDIKHSHIISFVTYRNKVSYVKDSYNGLPVAGFSNIYAALLTGQPLGAIVGNDYIRDDDGRLIIGNDGFPVVQNATKVIGDPNPDFILKSMHDFRWNALQLSLALEWKKGGVAWNGTQAALDYYGRSAVSARDRGITGYVFDGVNPAGNKNDLPVSFYDPNAPLENNRWVRYGEAGVATDYIQRTDYLRIRDIRLSYTVKLNRFNDRMTFSVYLNNLVVWTPYKGADPAQFLYDQPGVSGIDFFNLPSAKTWGCNILFQF